MPQIPGVPDHAANYEVVDPSAIEPKTKAAAAGASAGAVTSGFIIWGIDAIWYGGGAIDVPLPVSTFVTLVVTSLLAFAGGYYARHVQRA